MLGVTAGVGLSPRWEAPTVRFGDLPGPGCMTVAPHAQDSLNLDGGGQSLMTQETVWGNWFMSLHDGGHPSTRSHLSIIPVYLQIFQCFEGFCPELTVFYIDRFVNSSFLWEK